MGLSASQARLLTLTARQSNLEYEGQQINQQRTSLSNASSNYYNSLLEMKVPVPPSTNDYTKVVYTFNIGGNEATVKEALPTKQDEIGNTTYFVSYSTKLSTIGVAENESYKTSARTQKSKGYITEVDKDDQYDSTKNYYLLAMNRVSNTEDETRLREEGTKLYVLQEAFSAEGNDYPTQYILGPDGYAMTLEAFTSLKQTAMYEGDDEEQKALAIKAQDDLMKCKFFRYEDPDNIADDCKETKYVLSYAQLPNEVTFKDHQQTDIIKAIREFNPALDNPETDPPQDGLFTYTASNQKNYTVVDPQYADAFISADLNINEYYQYESTSGVRFVKREDVEGNINNQTRAITTSAVTTISIIKENTMSNARIEFDARGRISTITDEEGHTYTMTATTEKDEAAYEDAYNQYEYEQYLYDQRQSEINAQIEILQAQDKSLELRLSNLDTQHSAIQTELEAVKKVMSKNIDNSFKTFNA